MKKVRYAIVVSLIFSLALLFTACGGGENNADNGEEKVLHAMMFSEPDSLDPFVSASAETRGVVMENVHNGLVGYDENGELKNNRIADSWDISDDGLEYTFKIKEGAKFHDNSVLDSEDVKFTFDKLAGLDGGEANADFKNVESVEVIDDLTVKIKIKSPDASFLANCSIHPIVPAEDYNLVTDPIGCGPFKLVDYVEGQKLVYEKFDGYVGDAKQYFDRVEIQIMGDSNSVVMSLLSGDLDFGQVFGTDIPSLEDSDLVIEEGGKNTVEQFSVNQEKEPFNDVRVRQALSYAIDREALIETAMAGHSYVAFGSIAPSVKAWYNKDITKYEYNPEKAKELLKEAGCEDLSFTIKTTGSFAEDVNSATSIAAQLEEIGVHVDIQKIEWPTWMEEVYSKYDYEATTIGMPGELDPAKTLVYWESDYDGNFDRYSNKEVDKILNEAKAITDTKERKTLYNKAQKIMSDECNTIPLMETTRIVAHNPDLKGYVNYTTYYINYADMYYED